MKSLKKLIGIKGLLIAIVVVVIAKVFISSDVPATDNTVVIEEQEQAIVATVNEFIAMTDKQREGVSVIEDDDGQFHNVHRIGAGNRIKLSFPRVWTLYAGAAELDPKDSRTSCSAILNIVSRPMQRVIDGEVVFGFADKTPGQLLDAFIQTKDLNTQEAIGVILKGSDVAAIDCYKRWGGVMPEERITEESDCGFFSCKSQGIFVSGQKVADISSEQRKQLKASGLNVSW